MKWIDITEDLTEQGKKDLKVGQVLMFEVVSLKIMRKRHGKVWAKEIAMYTPEEANRMIIEADLNKRLTSDNI